MADVAIRASATAAVPRDYTIPGAQEILPKSVRAVMDGTGAGSAWLPCLQLLDPGGNVMFSAVASSSVAAGASVDVSWFPGLTSGVGSGQLQKFIGARIQASSTQSVPTNTNTDLVYQGVLYDTDGMANLGADARILTVNTAGIYLVVAETIWPWTAASTGRRINVVTWNEFYSSNPIPSNAQASDTKMATWQSDGTGGPTPYTTNTSVGFFVAAVGDFFASGGFQASGGSLAANGITNCFLAASLVGT